MVRVAHGRQQYPDAPWLASGDRMENRFSRHGGAHHLVKTFLAFDHPY
jgi:hypothetical protein